MIQREKKSHGELTENPNFVKQGSPHPHSHIHSQQGVAVILPNLPISYIVAILLFMRLRIFLPFKEAIVLLPFSENRARKAQGLSY